MNIASGQTTKVGTAFLGNPKSDKEDQRLRLGFVSADLRSHPVAFFLERLIERIDRSRFAIYVYSDVRSADEVTARFKKWSTVGLISPT